MKASVVTVVFNEFRHDARVEKIARSLSDAGCEVTVLATVGQGLPEREEWAKCTVLRSGNSDGPVSRGRRLLSAFCLSLSLLRMFRRFDVIHCNDLEPLFFAVLAKWLSFGRVKLVYDAHELETEKYDGPGIRKTISRCLERVLVRFVDGIVTVSPSIAEWYRDTYRLDLPEVVLNCPLHHEACKTDSLRSEFGIPKETKIILFQGGFSWGRGLPELLEAFDDDVRKDCAIVFLGFGASLTDGWELEQRVIRTAAEHTNVFHHPAVPQDRLLALTASADVGVCFTEDICLSHRYSLPNKIFEYAMAGTPMIVSDLPEMRRLVEDYQCGVICQDLSAKGIRFALDELLGKDLSVLGANARRMGEEHCWERQEEKLLALYEDILKVP